MPANSVGTFPLHTSGVPFASTAGDTPGSVAIEPIPSAVFDCLTARTGERVAGRPETPPISSFPFNLNSLLLPATLVAESEEEGGGGSSNEVPPGLDPGEGKGAGPNAPLVRPRFNEPEPAQHVVEHGRMRWGHANLRFNRGDMLEDAKNSQ